MRLLDDDHASNLVAVSTLPDDTEHTVYWPNFDHGTIVAATLVQNPHRYVDIADARWDQNATFIAHARSDIPRLIAEIRRLRELLPQERTESS